MAQQQLIFSRLLGQGTNQQSGFASFTTSLLAILVSQVGDKTFFLAMIWAMKYSKWIVFLGSYGALAVMTVLSTIFGKILPHLLSKFVTDIIVTVLFFYFGLKMLYQAYTHVEQQGSQNQELKQVEEQLKAMQNKMIEKVRQSQRSQRSHQEKDVNLQQKLVEQDHVPQKIVIPNSYILTQAFIMTFLAQWGDRSQIATIALAASFNAIIVTIGALLGHLICTSLAVQIGQWVSKRVKQKHVLYAGGIVFLLSGVVTLIALF